MEIEIMNPSINAENPLRIDCDLKVSAEDFHADWKMFFELDTQTLVCPTCVFDEVAHELSSASTLFNLYMQAKSEQIATFDRDSIREVVDTVTKYIVAESYDVDAFSVVECAVPQNAVFVYLSCEEDYEGCERLVGIFKELYPDA